MQTASFGRRLAAMFYDFLLLIALILVAVSLFTLPIDMIFGDNTTHQLLENPFFKLLYQCYLLSVGAGFYIWFWTHGGQTLGMKVWHLKLMGQQQAGIPVRQAILRLVLAVISITPLGVGFLWMLLDSQHQTLYDKWSNSRVVFSKSG